MATSIASRAHQPDPAEEGTTSRLAAPATAGPARGIAMGAALSAPMWIGILYLVRAAF